MLFGLILPIAVLSAGCSLVSDGLGSWPWRDSEKPPDPLPLPEKQEAGYIVSPGDLLEISVWKEEALTKVVTVLPDGKISFPLIGEVVAAGRTRAQITEELTERLTPFVPDPVVAVDVKQVNSVLIYVIGKVNSPGRFVHNTRVTVLQALATAGGLNTFAKRNKIKILRREGETTLTFLFRYDDVAAGRDMAQNILLQKGDVVVVP